MPPPNKDATEVVVTSLPPCDLHPERKATYDFKTRAGPRPGSWMNGCAACFKQLGGQLGLGKGQRLVLAPPAE
jgi:hypothetical protein